MRINAQNQSVDLSSGANRPRLLISEEGLQDEIGHWFEYCKAVVEIHEKVGVDSLVAMHCSAPPGLTEVLPSLPVFKRTSWSGLHTEPNTLKRYWGILSQNYLVYRTIDQIIRQEGPFDVVFAPTVTIHHVIGWRALAAVHGGKGIKRLVLLFRNNAGSYSKSSSTPEFKNSTRILALILKSFGTLIRDRTVCFATDSERLADEYELLCGIRPEHFPSPRIAPLGERYAATDGAVRFSCLGPARLEKGIDILQQAIKLHLDRHTSTAARFTIQWNQPIIGADGAPYEPDPELIADPRVRFLTNVMDSKTYSEELARTDCMLLPYRRASYFARISGVAVEGVTAGAPIICTKDTWVENLIKTAGAGIGVADGDAEGLEDAIEQMVAHFPEYSARAAEQAESARRINSAEVFLQRLWGPNPPFHLHDPARASTGT